MTIKGFFAGFLMTASLIAILQWRADPSPRSSDPAKSPARRDKLSAKPAIERPRADRALVSDCRRRIHGLLGEYPLIFDQMSEALRADVQQLVYGVIEIGADCPYARLQIRATQPAAASDTLRRLIDERSRYLQRRLQAGGVSAEIHVSELPGAGSAPWIELIVVSD